MGKVSDWLIEMEEDASYMTRQEFMDKHGETVIECTTNCNSNGSTTTPSRESRTMWVDPEGRSEPR